MRGFETVGVDSKEYRVLKAQVAARLYAASLIVLGNKSFDIGEVISDCVIEAGDILKEVGLHEEK